MIGIEVKMPLDAKSLILATLISNLSTLVLIATVAFIRKSKALFIFTSAYLCSAIGFSIYLINSSQPFPLAILLANLLIFSFYLLMTSGLRLYFDFPAFPKINLILVFALLTSMILFTYVYPSYNLRAQSFSALAMLAVASVYLPLRRKLKGQPFVFGIISIMLAEQLAIFVIRLVLVNAQPQIYQGILSSNLVTSFTMLTAIFNYGIWAAGILSLDFLQITDRLEIQNKKLESIALFDRLTGLSNRTFLEQELNRQVDFALRHQEPLSMILVDLDFFKRVNDQYGHEAGDRILISVAEILTRNTRSSDRVFRWGGEEFLILLPQTNQKGSENTAEKIRQSIEQHQFDIPERITASLGVAEFKPDEPQDIWFKRTDLCLYKAKHSGRNCINSWQTTDQLPLAMLRIDWQLSWECGNEIIDGEHRELLNLCNLLIDDALIMTDRLVQKKHYLQLLEHLKQHFSHEEEILEANHYPDCSEHQKLHNDLLEEFIGLTSHFDHENIDLAAVFNLVMGRIVIGHLLTSDILFFRKIL